MRYIAFVATFIFLNGCASFAGFMGGDTPDTTSKSAAKCECAKSAKTLSKVKFCGEKGYWIELKSYDNYESVALSSSKNENIALKRVPSANGIKLKGDGKELHFKSDEAIYSVNGKDMMLKICK